MAATKVMIPKFETTALDAIPEAARTVQATFQTNKTKDVNWRKTQLRKLYWGMVDYEGQLAEALLQDLHKSYPEALLTEIQWVKSDCLWMLENVDRFCKDEKLKPPDVPFVFAANKFRLKKEPLGAVLILSAFNYPVMLLMAPLVGAIAAGCTAVLKPSELAPSAAMVLKEMIETRLDTSAFAVVNGGIPETTLLLEQKWDKIFFTGSAAVATTVAKKAAETLTPLCLELGGKNPAFVTADANLPLAARRLLWGKTLNAGQVCLSHNYALVDKRVVDDFVRALNVQYATIFPHGARASPDLARIVNIRYFDRIKKLLEASQGQIVMGGQLDESDLFIEPTVVLVKSPDDPLMQEETFGPVWSIYAYTTLDEALAVANTIQRTPLALSVFANNKADIAKVLNSTTSGGATINDSFMHATPNTVPFGGVGNSGWGSYRGKASFDVFTHLRPIAEQPYWQEPFLRVRYMPYDMKAISLYTKLMGRKPNFDRNGQLIRGLGYWTSLVLGLGAASIKGALLRWLVVVAGCFYLSRR